MEQVVVHAHDDRGDHKQVYERLDHQNQLEECRICKLCGKRFRSAKALGGHLRVHYEEVKNSRNSNSNSNNKISCYVCKKSYPSLKSLYGHVSMHRERDWRGIRPPPPPAAPARHQNTNSDHVQDNNSCSDDNDLKSDIDVAKFLVRLANGTDRRGRKRTALIANNHTVPNYAEPTTTLAYKVNHPSSKKLKFFDGRTNNKTMEAISTSSTGKADQTSAWKTMKPTIMKIGTTRPMRDNLAFVFHQSHHHNMLQIQRKPQKIFNVNIDDQESGYSTTKHGPKGKLLYHGINNGSYRSSTQVDRADEEAREFECNICHKKFPSGQALGGHMRFHNYKKGQVKAPEAREVVASPLMAALPEEASDDGAREVLDFDLNELPFESSKDEGMSG